MIDVLNLFRLNQWSDFLYACVSMCDLLLLIVIILIKKRFLIFWSFVHISGEYVEINRWICEKTEDTESSVVHKIHALHGSLPENFAISGDAWIWGDLAWWLAGNCSPRGLFKVAFGHCGAGNCTHLLIQQPIITRDWDKELDCRGWEQGFTLHEWVPLQVCTTFYHCMLLV